MSETVVVIGAGQAAAQLAISLRQGGHTGPVLLMGDEHYLPYQRPPLSKKFLSEPHTPDKLYLRPENFWRDQRVTLHTGTAVTAVDRSARSITLRDGRQYDFGALVFATG